MKSKNSKINNICQDVSVIYNWLDSQINLFDADCSACGKCCDFDSFGHKLFVSSPEILYFYKNLKPLRKMTAGHCPYQQENKCTAREFRFAGCRIFFCKGNSEKQNALYEEVLNKFKVICNEHKYPYRYIELSKALEIADEEEFMNFDI
jgi:Fe-S-cluster containining protein